MTRNNEHENENENEDENGAVEATESEDSITVMSRRGVMKTGAAAGAAAALPPGVRHLTGEDVVGSADAVAPAVVAAGAIGAGVGAGGGAILATLSHRDRIDEIQERRADAMHDRFYADALEGEVDNSELLRGVMNTAERKRDYVRRQVIFETVEQHELGNTQGDAVSEVQDTVDDMYSEEQTGLANVWTTTVVGFARRMLQSDDIEELDADHIWRTVGVDGTTGDTVEGGIDHTGTTGMEGTTDWTPAIDRDSNGNLDWEEMELVNGELIEVPEYEGWMYYYTLENHVDFIEESKDGETDDDDVHYRIELRERDGEERAVVLNALEWMKAWNDLESQAEQERQNAEELVDTLWPALEDGEVDTEDIAGSKGIIEAGEERDFDDINSAAAVYRAQSLNEAEETAVIDINNVEYDALLFRNIDEPEPLEAGTIDPENDVLGDVFASLSVRSLPPEVDGDDQEIDITVVDANDETISDVDVEINDSLYPVDEDGSITATGVPSGYHTVTIYGDAVDSDTTRKTVLVGDPDGLDDDGFDVAAQGVDMQLEHTLTDERTVMNPINTGNAEELEDTAFNGTLVDEFELMQPADLEFEDRELIETEDTPEDIEERLKEAYEQEQLTEEDVEELLQDDGGGGLLGDAFGDALGDNPVVVIGAAIAAIIGIDRFMDD